MRLAPWLALSLLLAASAAWAAPAAVPQRVQVVFATSPSGAAVSRQTYPTWQLVGESGTALTLELPVDPLGRPAQSVHLRFHVDGYDDLDSDVPVSALQGGGVVRFPPQGALALVPRTPLAPLWLAARRHLGVLVVGLLALVALLGVALPRQRRLLARSAKLQALGLEQNPQDVNLGKIYQGWLLVRRLGTGGCATVYEAVPFETLEASEAVAVKIIHPEVVDEEFRRRFSREVRICQALDHPNIVRVIGWHDDPVLMIVMQLVRGETLREHMRGGALPIKETLLLLRQLAAAVSYAHLKNIVHLDLKPGNVLVTDNNRVRIMDFGIATGQTFTRLTATGLTFGTPGYMAPEQYEGVRDDPRSDQYACGVMAFEMLTGQRPWAVAGVDPMLCLSNQLAAPPPALTDVRPDLPAAATPVLHRMLAPQPADRYATLAAAWEALEATLLTAAR